MCLSESPLLVVAGPSGSGKSSLVRAGIVSALAELGRPAVVVTPAAEPAAELAGVLAGAPPRCAIAVDQLEELFTAGHPPEAVRAFLDRLVSSPRPAGRWWPPCAPTTSAISPPSPRSHGWPSAGSTC